MPSFATGTKSRAFPLIVAFNFRLAEIVVHILIVEDEFLLAMAISEALNAAGHNVVGIAATVGQALKIVQEKRAALALVDVRLADGSRGTDLARVLMHEFRTPTIFVTGSIDEARTAQESALGLIAKPCDPSAVVESVTVAQKIMNGRRVSPAEVPPQLTLF